MKQEEALQIVAVLSATFPAWKPTKATTTLWASMIEDLEYQLVDAAVRRIILAEDLQFPPSIARIRKEASVLVDPGLSVTPEEAWGEVLDAISHFGRNRLLLIVLPIQKYSDGVNVSYFAHQSKK